MCVSVLFIALLFPSGPQPFTKPYKNAVADPVRARSAGQEGNVNLLLLQ